MKIDPNDLKKYGYGTPAEKTVNQITSFYKTTTPKDIDSIDNGISRYESVQMINDIDEKYQNLIKPLENIVNAVNFAYKEKMKNQNIGSNFKKAKQSVTNGNFLPITYKTEYDNKINREISSINEIREAINLLDKILNTKEVQHNPGATIAFQNLKNVYIQVLSIKKEKNYLLRDIYNYLANERSLSEKDLESKLNEFGIDKTYLNDLKRLKNDDRYKNLKPAPGLTQGGGAIQAMRNFRATLIYTMQQYDTEINNEVDGKKILETAEQKAIRGESDRKYTGEKIYKEYVRNYLIKVNYYLTSLSGPDLNEEKEQFPSPNSLGKSEYHSYYIPLKEKYQEFFTKDQNISNNGGKVTINIEEQINTVKEIVDLLENEAESAEKKIENYIAAYEKSKNSNLSYDPYELYPDGVKPENIRQRIIDAIKDLLNGRIDFHLDQETLATDSEIIKESPDRDGKGKIKDKKGTILNGNLFKINTAKETAKEISSNISIAKELLSTLKAKGIISETEENNIIVNENTDPQTVYNQIKEKLTPLIRNEVNKAKYDINSKDTNNALNAYRHALNAIEYIKSMEDIDSKYESEIKTTIKNFNSDLEQKSSEFNKLLKKYDKLISKIMIDGCTGLSKIEIEEFKTEIQPYTYLFELHDTLYSNFKILAIISEVNRDLKCIDGVEKEKEKIKTRLLEIDNKIPPYNYYARINAYRAVIGANNFDNEKDNYDNVKKYIGIWNDYSKNADDLNDKYVVFLNKFQQFNSNGDLNDGYDESLSTKKPSTDDIDKLYQDYTNILENISSNIPSDFQEEFRQVFIKKILILSYNSLAKLTIDTPARYDLKSIHNNLVYTSKTNRIDNNYDKNLLNNFSKESIYFKLNQQEYYELFRSRLKKSSKQDIEKAYGTFTLKQADYNKNGIRYHITYCDPLYAFNTGNLTDTRTLKIIIKEENNVKKILNFRTLEFTHTAHNEIKKTLLNLLGNEYKKDIEDIEEYRKNNYYNFLGYNNNDTYLGQNILNEVKKMKISPLRNDAKYSNTSNYVNIFSENLFKIITPYNISVYKSEITALKKTDLLSLMNSIDIYMKEPSTNNLEKIRNNYSKLSAFLGNTDEFIREFRATFFN